jgi:hypothetical protein
MDLTPEEEEELTQLEAEVGQQGTVPAPSSSLTVEEEQELAQLESEVGQVEVKPPVVSALTAEEKQELAGLESELGDSAGIGSALEAEAERLQAQLGKEPELGGAFPFFNKEFVAGLAGAPVDVATAGINALPTWKRAALMGFGDRLGVEKPSEPRISDPFGGKESVRRGMANIGIPTPDREPETLLEHVGSTGGQFAATAMPAAKLTQMLSRGQGVVGSLSKTMWETLWKKPGLSAAAEVAGATAAGTSRYIAQEKDLSPGAALSLELGSSLIAGMSPFALEQTVKKGATAAVRTANNVAKKFIGKSVQQVDEAIATGVIDYKDLKFTVKQATGADVPDNLLNREIGATTERVMATEAATALSKPNLLKMPTNLKRVWASIAPSRTAGSGAQEVSINYKNTIDAAESEASRIERRVNKFLKKNPQAEKHVDDFLEGGDIHPSIEKLEPQLLRYRESMDDVQRQLVQQLDDGQMQHLGDEGRVLLSNRVKRSIEEKNYVTGEYEIFTNKNFKQNPALKAEARQELTAYYVSEGQTVTNAQESAKNHLDHLVGKSAAAMSSKARGPVGASLEGILRAKKQPGPAERKFLGEITEPGARMRGTLTRTSRLVARNAADAGMAKELEAVGLASRTQQEGMLPLSLRSRDETELFVNPEVQVAVNKLYADNFVDKSGDIVEDAVKDTLSTYIGLTKAVKVLGNPPSYAVQLWGNAINLTGMGMNAFNPAKAARGLRLALSDFGWIEDITRNPKARKALLDEMRDMERYGLKGVSVIESDLRATFDKGLLSNLAGKVVQPFGKVYSSLDVMGRYMGWKSNEKMFTKLFPGIDPEDAKRASARVMNDTYQNYDKLSNTAKWATKWGWMPQFASFTMEFARNQYNQGRMIKQMIQGTFGQEMGLKVAPEQLNAMRLEGTKRLTALLATYAGTYGVTEGIKSKFNVTPEKEAALRDTVLPEWDKNKGLAIALSEDGKTGSYANMSYISPQSLGIQALKAALSDAPIESLAAIAVEELVGEGTFMNQAAMRALDNRNERGKTISYSEDDFTNFKERLGFFFKETLTPGASREIDKFMKAQRGEGDYTMKEIAARQAGYRVNKFDIEEQAGFRIGETGDNFNAARGDFNNTRDHGEVSPEELEKTYQRTNEAAKQSFDQLVRHYNNLTTLDLSEDERIAVMRKAKVGSSTILDVMDNKYTDIPRLESRSVSDIYDELGGSNDEKLAEIVKLSQDDYPLRKKLINHHKSMVSAEYRGVSDKDRLYLSMDVEKRSKRLYEMGILENQALLNEMMNKNIVNKEVMQSMYRRQEAERSPGFGMGQKKPTN